MLSSDPFMQFIVDNKCEENCFVNSHTFIHTHKLFTLHDKIVIENCDCGKKLKYSHTRFYIAFNPNESGYLSDFRCENFRCDTAFRVVTPFKNSKAPRETAWIKIVYMPAEK